jgi:tRNA threonylcarbamoyladenosine biosynthesis protein TsaE
VQFTECSIEQLGEKAELLARRVTAPANFFLWGDMGTGKTVFARLFIRAYFHNHLLHVPSPTFSFIQTYSDLRYYPGKTDVWHIDLYRLKNVEEVLGIGLEEAFFKYICLIEWPDRLGNLFVPNRINIYLDVLSETTRAFSILYE